MNKKLGYYFKKGWVEGKFVFARLSFVQKLSLLMYLIVSAIGKILILTRPFFAIADENIGKMISETREYSIAEAFHGVNDPKKYLGLFCTYLFKDLTIGAISFLGFIPLMMYRGGFVTNPNQFMHVVFIVVHIVISATAIILVSLEYAGAGYVGANLPNCEASDIMYLSKSQLRKHKGKIFLTSFVQFIVTWPLTFAAFYFIAGFNSAGQMIIYPLISLLILFVLLFLNVIWFSKVAICCQTIRYEVYKDNIELRKPIVVKEVAGEEQSFTSLYKDEEKELEAISISQMRKKESK